MKKKNFKSLRLNKSTIKSFSILGGEGKTETCTLGSLVSPNHCHLGPREDTFDYNCPTV